MNSDVEFFDRWGKSCKPSQNSIIKKREGAFSCCVHNASLLLIWPNYAPGIPELPGGGIDPGENLLQANNREFMEETGFDLQITQDDIQNSFQQTMNFYANDVDEYWFYNQHFSLVTEKLEPIFFEASRPTPEYGTMRWVPLKELPELPLHAMHKKAIAKFGLI